MNFKCPGKPRWSSGASCFHWSSRRCCCSFSGVHLNSVDWTWSRYRAHTCLNKVPQIHIRAQSKHRVQGVVLSLWGWIVWSHQSSEHSGLHPVEEGGNHQDSWRSLERPGKGFPSNLRELEKCPKLPTDGCGDIFRKTRCCKCFQRCVSQVLSKGCGCLCTCEFSRVPPPPFIIYLFLKHVVMGCCKYHLLLFSKLLVGETPQQDLAMKFFSAPSPYVMRLSDEGRYLHHLLQVHVCAGNADVGNSTVSF